MFKVDLSNKVIAITGAGGIICSEFAKELAKNGAKVALLDINYDAAKKYADEIGENAFAVKCNCLEKQSIIDAKKEINNKFGAVNFLINGAGGNNPRASTDNETMSPDLEGVKDFFALEESGLKFVLFFHCGRGSVSTPSGWSTAGVLRSSGRNIFSAILP